MKDLATQLRMRCLRSPELVRAADERVAMLLELGDRALRVDKSEKLPPRARRRTVDIYISTLQAIGAIYGAALRGEDVAAAEHAAEAAS